MFNPVATYRFQFHKDFTFSDLKLITAYLKTLGVHTVYASPVFEAVSGSTHGYDSINPHRINPEIGTLEQLKKVREVLDAEGISWLQDIVPNHMAFHPRNLWLLDVLEKGPVSEFSRFFDLSHTSELYKGRVMVPFFGASLNDVISNGELQTGYEDERFVFKYYDAAWPLNILSYHTILTSSPEEPGETILQLLEQISQIHKIAEPKEFTLAWDEFRAQLASLIKNAAVKEYVHSCLDAVNKQHALLHEIAGQQVYRLCHWQETDSRINFRRFFTVNGLICLNIQDDVVFEHFHRFIKILLDDGIFNGLRIDHIDGLYDPAGYLEQLRDLTGDKTYIVVEKILKPGEDLPASWPVQGNTGYDFLAMVNNLFTQKKSREIFSRFYNTLSGADTPVSRQIHEKKALILYKHMQGELENLCTFFQELNLIEKQTEHITTEELKPAIAEFLIHCPVYRYYGNSLPLIGKELTAIREIFRQINSSKSRLQPAIGLLENVLLKKPLENNKEYNVRALRFYQRCMQLTGPLMAKGVEDTLMYTYHRFIGHNDVGDSPAEFGLEPDEFHKIMISRQEKWPLSINTTSTHDTKRGEDVRARLNVLTDLAEDWLQNVSSWQALNQNLKHNNAPDTNDEYFIYQTLIGSFPMPGCNEDNFSSRIEEYLKKALREAKQHSNWTIPNEDYENATCRFALALLDKDKPFWKSFETVHQRVCDFGIVNSLSQVLLKFTCPGIPDVYQGSELWDLSLVDPDNRRPVDYELRQTFLQELQSIGADKHEELAAGLWQNRYNAKIKLWLTHILLKQRKENQVVFEKGEYIPLEVKGRYNQHVMAFARRYQRFWYVVAVPLNAYTISISQKKEVTKLNWKDTRIILPPEAPKEWENLLLNTNGRLTDGITVNTLFNGLPVALLKLEYPENDRGAGLLMHITSLPSAFGVGDLGPEAMAFAKFLSRSCQKYWQLLPLSPTDSGAGHSPYSSYSSMAGNTLLISPELLAGEKLLDANELTDYHLPEKDAADYHEAEQIKKQLFDQAWKNFGNGDHPVMRTEFQAFCSDESFWLDDFALFVVLKQRHGGTCWFEWPDEYKFRNERSLNAFADSNKDTLDQVKWMQYIFSKQWKELKTYCNNKGIRIIGDLPFYVSYDSVDVWAHRKVFSLDESGRMKSVAGVPPDYFNENGQLWGMPVFDWSYLKKTDYVWWIQRIRKNMEFYDLLRLDHFRAFSDYWEVPANDETAINGKWITGPGTEFFQMLEKDLGGLPFVAEDLGDIDEAVHQLREEFNLPGMKVLQFAFGDDLAASTYIPHNYSSNYVVYTGTHDNNTTRGWYKNDIAKPLRKQIEQYTGIRIRESNVHHALGRLAYASVAKTAILPVQDVIGLDERARMNTPAGLTSNWLWRLSPGKLTTLHEKQLREWAKLYNRI